MPDPIGPVSDTQKDEDFLASARSLYKKDYEKNRTNLEKMSDDIRFYAEDQWLNEDRIEREAQNRPVITEDHLAPAVRQITNDMRMNKPAVKARPVDSQADPAIAEIYEGLIRNIEQQSFSSTGNAYVKAGENATISGMGAFRIVTEYTDDDTFDQDIRIKAIRNGLSVVWDADAESPTRDDATRCWVLTWMSKQGFAETYPGYSTMSFESPTNRSWFSDWYTGEFVLIAEYFYKKPKKKTLWRMADGTIQDVTDLDDETRAAMVQAQAEEAAALGEPLPPYPEEREIDSSEVWRAVINGADILEEPRKWPGKYIPVIAVIGEEVFLNESSVIRGLVRVGKDSQRMINYHNSAAVEHVALSPKQPYLGTTQQFASLENEWEIANRQNAPFLRYNHDPNAPGPPQRAQPPAVPAALLTLKQESVAGLQATTNVYPASTGADSTEISGVAIQRRDTQGDVANFHFTDNLNRSISYCGKQLLDLIPKIYDGERIVRILGEDDAEEMVEINMVNPETGELQNDLSVGKYDIEMVPGPSFSTKRMEAASFFEKILQSGNPDLVANTLDLLVKNLDLPGADELYERLRKQAIAKGIVEADPEKGEQPPGPPEPSPEMVLAQAEQMKAQAQIVNAEARQMEARTKLGTGIAAGRKDMASVEKLEAEADGQQIENIAALIEMVMATPQMQLALQTAAQQAITTLNTGPGGPNGEQPPLA
jgi:hypothetical protein